MTQPTMDPHSTTAVIRCRPFEHDWVADYRNPRNWTNKRKWTTIACASLYTFVTPLSSSIMAPALPFIAKSFNVTDGAVTALSLSIFLLAYAVSPLFYAPLSEMYGRKWLLDVSNVMFAALNIGCAFAPSVNALIGFRFLCGWFGAAPIAIGGGIVGDLFSEYERATAMALYNVGPLIGPAVGPVMGGFLSDTVGWKYCFVLVAAISGVASVAGLLFLRETYAPVVHFRLIKNADPENPQAMRHLLLPGIPNTSTKRDFLVANLSRPFKLLACNLVCFMLSLYMAVMYGIYYLMFSTFPTVFSKTYLFSVGDSGLAYLGLGVGFVAGIIIGGHVGNLIYHRLSQKNGGVGKPEFRIPVLVIGSTLVPIGLFWTINLSAVGMAGPLDLEYTGLCLSSLFSTPLVLKTTLTGNPTSLLSELYLVDSFEYAASALSAASVARSFVGFAFPLFATQMYSKLGTGGGNSLLAGITVFLGVPFPLWMWFRGEKLRTEGRGVCQ